jgi:2-polyprenyl-3-methyl-5-hydroxy-6-metoxy-1,4-benzoquinol methylase
VLRSRDVTRVSSSTNGSRGALRCPVCGGKAARLGVLPAPFPLHRCWVCSHVFAIATPADLEKLYASTYDGFREDPTFAAAVETFFNAHVFPRVGRTCRLVDVGCGNGTVLRVARALGLDAFGVDISTAAVERCKRDGLSAVQMDFTAGGLDGRNLDLVLFWDVIEHLLDPAAFIGAAARALRPGGWLLMKVPHHRALSIGVSAALPRISGAVLQTPAHLQFFSRKSATRILGGAFDHVDWIGQKKFRAPTGQTTLRKLLVRHSMNGLRALSRDGTLLAMARKAGGARTS